MLYSEGSIEGQKVTVNLKTKAICTGTTGNCNGSIKIQKLKAKKQNETVFLYEKKMELLTDKG